MSFMEDVYYEHPFLPIHQALLSAVKGAGLSTPESQHSQEFENESVICTRRNKKAKLSVFLTMNSKYFEGFLI